MRNEISYDGSCCYLILRAEKDGTGVRVHSLVVAGVRANRQCSAGRGVRRNDGERGRERGKRAGLNHPTGTGPSLTSFDLYGCAQVSDVGVQAIGAGCHGHLGQLPPSERCQGAGDCLTRLVLVNCREVSDVGVKAIGTACPSLGAGCPSLTSLVLTDCYHVSDVGVQAIGAVPGVQVLHHQKIERPLNQLLFGELEG